MKPIKEIIICHQYYTPEHFKALYDCAEDYGVRIDKYVVLSKRNIFGRAYKTIIRGEILKGIHELFRELRLLVDLRYTKGKNLIVGLAPYDQLMNKYRKVFSRNKCVYFTSFTGWNSDNFDRGSLSNRAAFLDVLQSCFVGAACVSQQTECELKQWIKKTAIVNHAIDIENYKKKCTFLRNGRFIFIGRVTDVKNIKLMCEWFIKNCDKNISLTIVGEGDLDKYVRECAKKYSNIIQVGRWKKEDIKKRLWEYDYLILPSEKEPYGIVLLEALAAGLPCIVSDSSGPKEIINSNNGIIFSLKDKEKNFDYAMKYALAISDEEYRNLSLNAIEESNQYSSQVLVKKWLQVLK